MVIDGKAAGAEILLDRWRESGDLEAWDSLVSDHLPLVGRLCRRFAHLGEPLEDLVQVGTIGLLKAINKFDPLRGNNFAAFAVPVIVGEIKNYFRDHGWAVKVPRKLQQRKMAVDRTVVGLTQELGRVPTVAEIGRAAGFSTEEVYQTFEVERFGRPLSLDAEYDREDSQDPVSILDYLGSEDPDLEGLADKLDLKVALDCVGPREQTILFLKFYSGLSQTAIAQRLGISQMHVSRLQRNALSKLRLSLTGHITD